MSDRLLLHTMAIADDKATMVDITFRVPMSEVLGRSLADINSVSSLYRWSGWFNERADEMLKHEEKQTIGDVLGVSQWIPDKQVRALCRNCRRPRGEHASVSVRNDEHWCPTPDGPSRFDDGGKMFEAEDEK